MYPNNQNPLDPQQPQPIAPPDVAYSNAPAQGPGLTPQPQQPMAPPVLQPVAPNPGIPPQPALPSLSVPGQMPQMPQPGLPLAPAAQSAYGAPYPNVEPSQPPKNRIKLALKVGGGLIAALIIFTAVVMILGKSDGLVTYSSKDLSTVNASHYSLAYPKEWKNYTDNEKIVSGFGFGNTQDFGDLKVFAYGVNSAQTQVYSALLTADQSSGVTDGQLNQALQITSAKQQMTQNLQQSVDQLGTSAGNCKAVNNKTDNIAYNTSRYIVQLNVSFDCVHLKATQNPTHFVIMVGMKDGYIYLLALGTDLKDWNHNSSFYMNDVLGSFDAN